MKEERKNEHISIFSHNNSWFILPSVRQKIICFKFTRSEITLASFFIIRHTQQKLKASHPLGYNVFMNIHSRKNLSWKIQNIFCNLLKVVEMCTHINWVCFVFKTLYLIQVFLQILKSILTFDLFILLKLLWIVSCKLFLKCFSKDRKQLSYKLLMMLSWPLTLSSVQTLE